MNAKGKGAGKASVGKGYASVIEEQTGNSRRTFGKDSQGSANVSKVGSRVKAAPGPGEGLTRAMIKRDRWDIMEKTWVLEFYGHHSSQKYGCFSNFHWAPFEFVVPEEFCAFPLSLQDRAVACDFSEKAIMLCKAAAMGDRHSYHKIATSNAEPAAIKKMGREVQGFDEHLWINIECSVAFEVVYQKFLKLDKERAVLLGTEDWVLAEATKNDRNWGIGIDKGDRRVHTPKHWQGTNMLGWALMEARETLRRAAVAPSDVALAPASYAPDDVLDTSKDQQTTSALTEQEKAFLKIAKKVRDVHKLESSAAGGALEKMQAKKLEGKKDLYFELSRLEQELPSETELRAKNADLLVVVTEYLSKAK